MSQPQEPRATGGDALEERETIKRNLAIFQRAAVVGALLGAASDLATGNRTSAAILMAGAVVVVMALFLLRIDRLQLSAVVFGVFLVSAIHALCVVGEGVHDTASILYPVAILAAALMLDRRFLATLTLACIASVAILVAQRETVRPNWAEVFDVSLILIVTAVAVDLLLRGVLRGASEARKSERRLAEAYEELEARNAELERFTFVVSHDLKSPLVTIRGFLDYVEEDARRGDHDRLGRDVERIRIAATRMGHLLDDLLELSRTGQISRAHGDVLFGEVAREARAVVSGGLGASGVTLTVEPAAAARTVHGDRDRLVELVQNLLDNAAKFTLDGRDPEVVIGLRRDPEGGEDVFTVSDNGMGIDPAHQERIFDLFHRLDSEGEGTGLGLALVRRIVETHGGRIWAESEGRGRGATFCFTLPPGRGEA